MKHIAYVCILALLPATATAQTQEDEDKGYLTNLIEDNLSGDTRDVNIVGFEGALSSEATIERLTVADSEGVWLTLEDVTLDWNRSALLRGAIDVTELSAALITVARAPVPDTTMDIPDAEATPFALPELPVSINLDELRIDEIALGESFLGEPIRVSLTGSASLSGGAGSADIQATRLDERTGAFAIVGGYDNTTQVLDLNLDLNEGPDGIIARLIDLPGRPAVELTLAGTGPLTDYAANLRLATDGIERLTGDITLTETEAGQVFDLDAGGDVTPLFIPEYQTFFGPDVQLQATGTSNETGGFNLSNLNLSGRHIRLSGNVRTDAEGWPERIALTGDISDPGGDIVLLPLSGTKTYVQRLDLEVDYDRQQSDDWSANFQIDGLERPGLLIDTTTLRGGGTLLAGDTPAVTANFNYGATGLELDDAGSAEALGDAITGTAQITYQGGSPTRITELTLSGSGIELLADATIQGPEDGLRTQSNIALSVTTLERFATLTGQDLAGGADLNLISTVSPLDGFFDILLNGTTNDLEIGIAEVDSIIAGTGDISVLAERDTEGTRLQGLQITTDAGEITANANLTSGISDAEFNVVLNNVGLVLDEINGPARVGGTVSRQTDAPIEFDITGSGPDAQLTARGSLMNDMADAVIGLNASNFATYAPLIGDQYAGAANITLDVNAPIDASTFNIALDGQIRNIQTGIDQVDPLLRGAGTVSAELARTGPESYSLTSLNVATEAATITGNGSGSVTGPVEAAIALRLADIGIIAPGLSGPLSATADAARDGDGVTQVTLDATGPGTDLNIDARIADATDNNQISGSARANIANLRPFQNLIGQPVSGGINAVVAGTLLPDLSRFNTEITLRTQDIAIANPSVDVLLRGTGTVNANVALTENGLNVRNLAAETNNVSLNATLNATENGGSGQFDARLRDIGLFTDQLSGPVTATGTATRNGSTWGVDVNATGPGGIGAQVDGTASDSGTLNLRINGNAPLGIANDIIAPRRISGEATFGLNVNGPPQLSSVTGRINLNNARLAAPTLNQALENINGAISLTGSQAEIAITGQVERGGQLAITGPVGLASPNNANIAVQLTDVILKDPTLYESSVDGTINIVGPLAGGARIGGTLTLGPSEIQVPSSGLGTLGELPNVTHIGASPAVRQTLNRADVNEQAGSGSARASGSGPSFPLDITINAPSRIFIRGRGLDAELGGSLNLGGTTSNVIPVGEFSLIRGRIDILQQRFDLTEGTASLQGDFEPFIRLVASTESSTGTIINIIVEGPASAPEVTFSSTPELPQDEVLSQLIFGRNLSEISPLQAVQLAAAVSTLAGRGGGGLVDNFRQSIGLDDFDVTTDEQGNAAVRAGAYVSENVYTDVTVSSDGSTEVNINLDITDEITAKGTAGADGETSIGIFFERDY